MHLLEEKMSSWNEEETDLQDVSIKSKEKLAALDATCMVSSGTLSLLSYQSNS